MSVIEIPWVLKENDPISEIVPNLKWTDQFMRDMFSKNINHIICPYPSISPCCVYDLMIANPTNQYGTIVDMTVNSILLDLDDDYEYELISLNEKGILAATNIYAVKRSLVDDEYLVERINTFLVILDKENKTKINQYI